MSIRARLTLLPAIGLALLALAALPGTSEAQFGKRLKDAVKRTAEDKAIQKATDTESKAIDGADQWRRGAARQRCGQPAAAAAAAARAGSRRPRPPPADPAPPRRPPLRHRPRRPAKARS